MTRWGACGQKVETPCSPRRRSWRTVARHDRAPAAPLLALPLCGFDGTDTAAHALDIMYEGPSGAPPTLLIVDGLLTWI